VNDVAAALAQLQKQGAKKFLLDLRNSASGKPEDGATLANLFVDKGTLTYLQGQKVPRQNIDADPAKAIYKQQMVLITNRGTATAAEVAAAALLDSKRAEIVGERTYGDAAMRRAISMDDGGAVILSVAKYYSPSGKAIQDTGVTPTILVTDNDGAADAEEEAAPDAPKKEGDPLMKRAIEVLTNGKSQQSATKKVG
jgi:carboxyl-terminal processing protease